MSAVNLRSGWTVEAWCEKGVKLGRFGPIARLWATVIGTIKSLDSYRSFIRPERLHSMFTA